MSRPTYMSIDLAALRYNLSRVRSLTPHCAILAMVKANAYGHGLIRVAEALSAADALGVASIDEGIKLRESGISQPIVLMEGIFHPEEIDACRLHHFILVVHHLRQVEMLESAVDLPVMSIWLKINTGMNRLGIPPQDMSHLHARLSAIKNINKPIGLMTHFAQADNLESDATMSQYHLFNQTTASYAGPRSLANSAAILAWPDTHADWVRPGLMLYGASPFATQSGFDHGLKPVMTLSSRIIAITKVKKGDKVGYGGTWMAPEDMSVGVVGIGYGDGYPQFAQNGTPTLVGGKVSPLVGRVSMDMLTIDLRNVPQATIGDPVILWGAGLPVELVARFSNSSAYEILTRMTPRPKIEVTSSEITSEMTKSTVHTN